MPTENPQTRHPEAHFTEEERNYLIAAPANVAFILRGAMERSAMVTVYCDNRGDFAITSLLEVSPEQDRLVFDLPAHSHVAAALQKSPVLTFVTSQEGIKIKFQVGTPTVTIHDGRPALASRMPAEVLRLQRRDAFRVACPMSRPVRCTIPYVAEGQAQKAELMALDISLGGLAVMNMHPQLHLEPGNLYPDCNVVLPDVGVFRTGLEVRNAYEVTLKNGQVTMRAGCRFADPEPGALTLVQRYTMRAERERTGRL